MFLKINTFIAVSALAVSTAAVAQNQPAQPTTGKSETAPGQTQTTPGQMQTTPGEASQNTPATTGETPSGQTTATGKSAEVTRAVEADFKKGATVYDSTGAVIGTVDSFTSSSATINTGKVRAAIPLSSFGKGDTGLVIGMSKSEFEAAASAATPKTKPKKAD
jgi:hypothetical protein